MIQEPLQQEILTRIDKLAEKLGVTVDKEVTDRGWAEEREEERCPNCDQYMIPLYLGQLGRYTKLQCDTCSFVWETV
ncbi:hypothetical protein LCGC14_2120800, partial [marine sediment metagenome]